MGRAGDLEGFGIEVALEVRGDFPFATPGVDEVRRDFPLPAVGVVGGLAMPVDLVRRSALAAACE